MTDTREKAEVWTSNISEELDLHPNAADKLTGLLRQALNETRKIALQEAEIAVNRLIDTRDDVGVAFYGRAKQAIRALGAEKG
ncbi:MAG: hypothetical protein ACXWYM_00090 [Candidatus Binatia bacterium]